MRVGAVDAFDDDADDDDIDEREIDRWGLPGPRLTGFARYQVIRPWAASPGCRAGRVSIPKEGKGVILHIRSGSRMIGGEEEGEEEGEEAEEELLVRLQFMILLCGELVARTCRDPFFVLDACHENEDQETVKCNCKQTCSETRMQAGRRKSSRDRRESRDSCTEECVVSEA